MATKLPPGIQCSATVTTVITRWPMFAAIVVSCCGRLGCGFHKAYIVPKLRVKPAMREAVFVDLGEAYLCTECEAIGNSANHCPHCQSNVLFAVTRALPRHRDSVHIVCKPIEEPVLEAA